MMVVPIFATFAALSGCGQSSEVELTPGLFELCFQGDELRPLLVNGPVASSGELEIPRSLGPWESFGFFIESTSTEPVEVYAIVRLPAPPRRLGGEWAKYTPADAISGMKSDVRTVHSSDLITWGLDDDDPLGLYSMTVYVGDRESDRFLFRVSEADWEPYRGDRPRDCSAATVGKT